VNVWYGTAENAELSNLAFRPFVDKKDRYYISVEHAYQTWKSGSFDNVYYKPWKAGSKFIGKKRANFNSNIELMYKIMKLSFENNPIALAKLVDTLDVEITHLQDRGIWRNKFPELLMKVRKELR